MHIADERMRKALCSLEERTEGLRLPDQVWVWPVAVDNRSRDTTIRRGEQHQMEAVVLSEPKIRDQDVRRGGEQQRSRRKEVAADSGPRDAFADWSQPLTHRRIRFHQ